ncbi:beta-1,4-galactosyltransferase 2 [Tachysurus ichikawai]
MVDCAVLEHALISPELGRLLIEFSSLMSMERVQRENPNVTEGGKYTPPDCRPKQKVAIIIPFRHREHHLKYWLHYLHPILRRQKIDYGIYIVNQKLPNNSKLQGRLLSVYETLDYKLQLKPPPDLKTLTNPKFQLKPPPDLKTLANPKL